MIDSDSDPEVVFGIGVFHGGPEDGRREKLVEGPTSCFDFTVPTARAWYYCTRIDGEEWHFDFAGIAPAGQTVERPADWPDPVRDRLDNLPQP